MPYSSTVCFAAARAFCEAADEIQDHLLTLRSSLALLDNQARILALEGRLTEHKRCRLTHVSLALHAHLRPGVIN